ncbi:tubulin polyglutamylase ttll6-like isoform X1 [Gigantopelta aegis]|uniref:tubulin polyglutamylase ttll6-like isoform X1 n=1 Tax=Gigantopelta aegis TaxID=1735272 RepID=UPI001B88D596|nr:tubulin polyglutamylase ttll6-like isoform X1 [Gigantopelta aegis]
MSKAIDQSDEDRVVSSSSSSSDSESDVEEVADCVTDVSSSQELTLVDVESTLLVQPHTEEDDEGEPDMFDEGEGEGETDIQSTLETPEPVPKRDLTPDKKKKKKKKKKWIYICLTNCKYDVVRRVSRRFGFREVSDDEDWTLYWTDYSVALERVMDMKKYQKINHFPGMNEICRKDLLARNLNRMYKVFPKDYNVFPKTWCLPADYGDFQAYTRQKKNKTYILKPESGCQGRGIWVTKNPREIKPHEHMICQVYVTKPFLIDGFKFDLRIYVLITSCDPLRIFVFKDGLARFATTKYYEPTHNNTDNVYMHLTNYAINKHSSDFVRDDEAGSKRRITTVNKYLQDKGFNVEKMWSDIDDVIVKTCISAHSVLKHNYRTCFPNHVKGSACFEILGIDILLDKKMRPYILEVNHSPSFATDADLDRDIKGTLIWDTLNLVNFGACDRRRCIDEERRRIKDRLMGKYSKKETKEEFEQAQSQFLEQQERYENSHMGNFRRIYPMPGFEKYEKFFHTSGTLFQETAAFRARTEMARQQREELSRKKEKSESLKQGRKKDGLLRPESPNSRKRRALSRTCLPSRMFNGTRTNHESPINEEPIDTTKPVDIREEEELERISGLLQRDNLVRGLGIVEHVYRLLHCTPGTMGSGRPDPRTIPPAESKGRPFRSLNFQDPYLGGRSSCTRIKDRQYYKTLLDRYFGGNHALSNDSVTLKYEHRCLHRNLHSGPGSTILYPCVSQDSTRQVPNLYLSHVSAQNKNAPERHSKTKEAGEAERKQLSRKTLANARGTQSSVVPDTEYRNLVDTEAERNRLLARSGYNLDWKSDATTPSLKARGLSAHGQRKESDLMVTKFHPQPMVHGLSVVSAPAPVVQRPELQRPNGMNNSGNTLSRLTSHLSVKSEALNSHRSTKSQRIRGASNNMRIRQLEMRENHAFVYS